MHKGQSASCVQAQAQGTVRLRVRWLHQRHPACMLKHLLLA